MIAHAVGAVRRIVLPKVGDQVTAGQPLFRLEHDGRSVTIPSAPDRPGDGREQPPVDQPELLSSDPYGSGWVCHLSPTRVERVAPSVRFGEQAMMWLESEFVRFREFHLRANLARLGPRRHQSGRRTSRVWAASLNSTGGLERLRGRISFTGSRSAPSLSGTDERSR